jgi:hypothetical protein
MLVFVKVATVAIVFINSRLSLFREINFAVKHRFGEEELIIFCMEFSF